MKKIQISVLVVLSIFLSSCQKLAVDILNHRIESAYNYIGSKLVDNNTDKLSIPTSIPFDQQITVTFLTKNPERIDNTGKIFRSDIVQISIMTIFLHLNGQVFERDFIIEVNPVDSFIDKEISITFINIGQGDAILIELPNNEVMIIDSGDGFYGTRFDSLDITLDVLNQRKISTINYLIATHDHIDHSKNIPSLFEYFEIQSIYSSFDFTQNYWNNIFSSLNNETSPVLIYPKQGDFIIDIPGLYVRVVSNLENSKGNPSSLMVWLKYLDFSVLFASDGDKELAEKSIIDVNLSIQSDILKVGHHGLNDSTSDVFLKKLNPTIAILTTLYLRNDRFFYPDESIRLLRLFNVELYETARNNHLYVNSDGRNFILKRIDSNWGYYPAIIFNYYD